MSHRSVYKIGVRSIGSTLETNLRLYRSGDLACYLPDGNIEFLGRIDDQVKIRGYRIELGEIESVIARYKDVSQSVVCAREDEPGRKILVAYIVQREKSEKIMNEESTISRIKSTNILIEELREYLCSILPVYMIPSFFILMDEIPLTSNGKVDRKKLPAPDFSLKLSKEEYLGPRNDKERELCEIWSTVLGVAKVGIKDHFFRLGGDSIISIQLVSKARQKGIIFNVKDVFNHPTVEALASVCLIEEETRNSPIQDIFVSGMLPLTPIQHWFFGQNPVIPHHFNQAMWFKSEELIDLDKLKNALTIIYQRHDGFRLRYKKEKNGWKQYYVEEILLPWNVCQNFSEESLSEVCTYLQSSLNIEQGPLSQLLWVEEKNQLLWVIHHLIVDGVSWRILLEDLNLAYAGKDLGLKTHSFKDWSLSLAEYHFTNEIDYYHNELQNITRLPRDFEYSGSSILKEVQKVSVTFSKQTTTLFLQKAHRSYGTLPNDLLLLALVLSVGDCFGKYQVLIDLEGHGREDLGNHFDLTRTIGWFTCIHPVNLSLSDPFNIDQSIKDVKEHLRNIPHKGVSYGILSHIQKMHDVIQGEILFNYLGQWSNVLQNGDTFFFVGDEVGILSNLNNPHSHLLVVNGGVNEGQLAFEWTFDRFHYKTETIEKLAKTFKLRLEALIDYCSEEKNFGFSPSDFPHVKLKGKQLDNLLKKIGSGSDA